MSLVGFAFISISAFILTAEVQAQDEPSAPADQNSNPVGETAPQNDVSFQTFYDSLQNEGTWIQSPDYGYVWQPSVTDDQWAPYTNGHWVFTDAGWTWVSDEPWGWAAYHYGRWVNLDGTGWCWVPGYTWGPAWVSWRCGQDYCGWAPLPPDSLVGIDYANANGGFDDGFHIGGDCDDFFGIGAGWYTFLPIFYLGDLNYRGHYANRHENDRLINRTTNLTNINVNRKESASSFRGVTVDGPSLLQVNARSQTPISHVALSFTDRTGGGEVEGRSLALFAPRVSHDRAAHPQGEIPSLSHEEMNRGTDLARPLAVNSRLASAAPTSREISESRAAQAKAPPEAKVATFKSPVHYPSVSTVTSFHPEPINRESHEAVEAEPESRSMPSRSMEVTPHYSNPEGYQPSAPSRPAARENYSRPATTSNYSRPASGGSGPAQNAGSNPGGSSNNPQHR